MPRIVISYRREDAQAAAGRICDRLTDRYGDDRVFMDIDNIPPGVDFVAEIQKAVKNADVLLVVIGEKWAAVADKEGRARLDNPSDFVRLEVRSALALGVPIIPVLVGEATMPRVDELPEALAPMVRFQAVEIYHHRFRGDMDRLIRGIEELQRIKAAEAERQAEEEGRRNRERDEAAARQKAKEEERRKDEKAKAERQRVAAVEERRKKHEMEPAPREAAEEQRELDTDATRKSVEEQRRTIDEAKVEKRRLIGAGIVASGSLVLAGALATWGPDYVWIWAISGLGAAGAVLLISAKRFSDRCRDCKRLDAMRYDAMQGLKRRMRCRYCGKERTFWFKAF